MRIAILDLMPLLWGLCVLLSVVLFLYGERSAPVRTVPAAAAALFLYFTGQPPRMQTAVFFGMYALSAAVYAVVCRVTRRREKNAENLEKPLDSAADA